MAGDYPPCCIITVSEILGHIGKWSRGEASISEVLNLISSWASGEEKECSSSDYVVVSRKGSSFHALAAYYAEKKNARLLNYSNSIDEVIPELANLSPTYLALVLPPEDLTPDYMDHVDEKLRELDSDPFLDVAYGYITSFNSSEGYAYADKLLAYNTPQNFSVHGINAGYELDRLNTWYGLNITDRCMEGFSFVSCSNATRTGVDELAAQAKDNQILLWGLHGLPWLMDLYGGEFLVGDRDEGLVGFEPPSRVPISLNASLAVLTSCNTARISGKPSIIKDYDSDVVGDVDTSIALSLLKSGALNVVGPTHEAVTDVVPTETITPESILRGQPIGIALKDFKNRYVQEILFTSKNHEGSPMTNQSVRDWTAFQLRNWVLLGDPSIVVSLKNIVPEDCIEEFNESSWTENIGGEDYLVKQVHVKIRQYINDTYDVSNTKIISQVHSDSIDFADSCAFSIPLDKDLVEYNMSSSGVNPWYNSYITEKSIVENAGNELLVTVPTYLRQYPQKAELYFTIKMKA